MNYLTNFFLFSLLITVVGCSSSGSKVSGSSIPVQDNYVGTEITKIGTRVAISDYSNTKNIAGGGGGGIQSLICK